MSVINKVLRDLDKRQGSLQTRATSDDLGARIGTSSVDASQSPGRPRPAAHTPWTTVAVPGLLVVAGMVAVALWHNGTLDGVLPLATTATPPATPVPVPTPVAAPASVVQAPASEPTPAASAPEPPPVELAPASRFESVLALPKDLQMAEPARATASPSKAPPTQTAVRTPAQTPEATLAATAANKPVAASASVPAPAETAQRQSQAGRDALAHAQALWSAGSRDSAIELLQQAVLATERAATSAPAPATTQTLVLLVRELGRMQLSEGRPAAVWDTQSRLEPLLRNEPDMWALRANAAQRLGRHQESVQAYMTALQSRPTEQRWLLGAAVSMAALGQLAGSAEMAEKARNVGPISRDVLAYLRQMGVSVKD